MVPIEKEVISYHVFMFPFILEKKEDKSEKRESKRDKKKSGDKKDDGNCPFPNISNKNGWVRINDFANFLNGVDSEKDQELYNQIQYFYDHVQPIIFDQGSKVDGKESDYLVKQYSFEYAKKLTYTITINRKEKEKQNRNTETSPKPDEKIKTFPAIFILKVEKIDLKIYSGNIGILSFQLRNENYKDPEEILLINQFGRRIYPPFLDKNFKEFNLPGNIDTPLQGTQHRELASEIIIEAQELFNGSDKFPVKENFSNSHKITKDLGYYVLPGYISIFLDKAFDKEIYTIRRVLDDRMFVLCWYGSEHLQQLLSLERTNKIKKNKLGLKKELELYSLCDRQFGGFESQGFYRDEFGQSNTLFKVQPDGWNYINNEFWYRFVFVDGQSASVQNDILQNQQMKSHTYDRWIGYNTLIGISRYSFVCVSANQEYLKKAGIRATFLINNMKTIYYEMVQLVLAQRAMVLKYSKEASVVSTTIKNDPKFEDEITGEKVRNLMIDYTIFINRIFHREVTAQEQGIELYDMLQKHLRVEEHAKELEKEIDELHRNADMIEEYNNSKKLDNLTYLGATFLIPSLIFAFLSANLSNPIEKDDSYGHGSWVTGNSWIGHILHNSITDNITLYWATFYHNYKVIAIVSFILIGSYILFKHILDLKIKFNWRGVLLIASFIVFLLLIPIIRTASSLSFVFIFFFLMILYLVVSHFIKKRRDKIQKKVKR